MQEQKWGPLLRNEQQKKAEDVTEAEAKIQQAGSTQLLITNQHLLELRLFRYINIVTNPHQNASHFDLFVSENVFLFVEFCILFNSLLFLNPKGSKMSCFVCFRLCDELMVFFFFFERSAPRTYLINTKTCTMFTFSPWLHVQPLQCKIISQNKG